MRINKLLLNITILGFGLCAVSLAADMDTETGYHPLCDGSGVDAQDCVAIKMTFTKDFDAASFVDLNRIESRIDNTCTVSLVDGSSTVASKETIGLRDGKVEDGQPFRRVWFFPKGCRIWAQAAVVLPTADNVKTGAFQADRNIDIDVKVDDGYSNMLMPI